MSKRLLIFIIVLVGFALSGIIYVQLYYIKNAFIQNELMIDQKVNDAMQAVVQKLEQAETVEKINMELKKSKLKQKKQQESLTKISIDNYFDVKLTDSLANHLALVEERNNPKVVWTENDDDVIVIYNDSDNLSHNYIFSSKSKKSGSKAKYYNSVNDTLIKRKSGTYQMSYQYDVDQKNMLTLKKEVIEKKKKKIKNVVNKMVAESDDHYVYTRKRLNYLLMDSLLRNSFNERDITLPYEYSVVTDSTERMETSSTPGFDKNTEYRKYETVLFPNDIVPKTDKIVIYFPERQKHLIKSLSVLLPSSLFFSLIIIVAFSISITMVLKQKKISDIKTDFINNMTHEFKTPIATISLAADTIVNPKMIGDTDKIKQFIGIIKDENKRMNMQVERILQMAQLDKKEMELNFELLDVHILILRAIGNIDIQLKQLNGKISTKLEALDSFVSVDEIHFINIVNNLLDNALKYTDNAPEILVSSSQLGNGILLSFWDKGFGMSKEVQGRIFEKFYRVTKGNIHNIKGFGLGLSYVKAIVELHGGRISVKSEQNKGSRFDIFLPQKNKENGKQI